MVSFDSEDLMVIPEDRTEYRNSFWVLFNLYERLYFIEVKHTRLDDIEML